MPRTPFLPTGTTAHDRKGRLTRLALVGALAVSLSATAVIGATTASAAVPTAPDNLTVFPDRDFVSVEGYQNHVGETALLEVKRAGVVVGSAKAAVAPGDVAFEVNHPGGACWGAGTALQVTPDILPGDVVSISFAGTPAGDTRVQDAFVNTDAVLSGSTVTVTGHIGADVVQANTEQRIVDPALTAAAGKRDVRAVSGPMTPAPTGVYSSGLEFNTVNHTFTATYIFDDPAVAQIAANASLGERLLSWEVVDAAGNRQGLTIAEFGEVGGPGVGGCPAGASDAVTATTPGVLNQAAVAAGGILTVSGVSFNSSQVALTVKGAGGAAVATATATPTPLATTLSATLPGGQTWTTTVPISALTAAADGPLELAITTTRVTAGVTAADPATQAAIPGASTFLLKDTVAPAAPSLSLGTGTYVGTQQVTVTGSADTSVLRYQIGGPAVADPTPASPAVPGQIAVTSSQTLKVVGFDAAGNVSPVQAAAYTITQPVPPAVAPAPPLVQVPPTVVVPPATTPGVVAPTKPGAVAPTKLVTRSKVTSAPRIGAATAGKRGGKVTARIRWKAPLSIGGSSVTRYKVSVRRVGRTAVVTRTVSARARSLTVSRLVTDARYRFFVTAVNARGTSPRSALSRAVVAR